PHTAGTICRRTGRCSMSTGQTSHDRIVLVRRKEFSVVPGVSMKLRIVILIAASSLAVLSGCNRNPAAVREGDIQAGQKYFDQHKYDEASLEFRRALQADPRSADAEYRLGLSYMQLQRWAEAY